MGSSKVLAAVPVLVLACAFPAFSQDAGKPVVSSPNDSKSGDSKLVDSRQSNSKPVIVQPGAPGQPSRVLPADTRATPPPISAKDIEFMEGMIMHHSQAVEMTALIEDRTEDPDIKLLGAKIMQSQEDEIEFMKAWLKSVGQWGSGAVGQSGWRSGGASHDGMSGHAGMPGMLSAQQMTALKRASGKEFDRLFLLGMIQHHEGALVMVKDLFDTAGAGQNAELFGFATDVDSGQRAEIATMKRLLTLKFAEQ